jgi:anti-sigma regulatory factor (Ser/Thr protein kinase)
MTNLIDYDTSITLESESAAEEDNGIKVSSDLPHWVSLHVACKITSANLAAEFLRDRLGDLNPKERERITLALRELLLNAVEHGGHLDAERTVNVSYIRTSRSIVCSIRDPGEGFSFDHLEHSAMSSNPDQLFRQLASRVQRGMRPGGLGLVMVRRVADDLLYSASGNEVVFIKYL